MAHHSALRRLHSFVKAHGDHDSTHGVVHVSWVTFNCTLIAEDSLTADRHRRPHPAFLSPHLEVSRFAVRCDAPRRTGCKVHFKGTSLHSSPSS